MNNPFEHNSKSLPSGFYFDRKQKCIAFYFVGQEDNLFSSSSTYYRYYKPTNLPSFMIMSNPQDSNVRDLVDLKLDILKDKDNLLKDFNWIKTDDKLSFSFVQFLIEEEKYLILDLFKTFSQTPQISNGRK